MHACSPQAKWLNGLWPAVPSVVSNHTEEPELERKGLPQAWRQRWTRLLDFWSLVFHCFLPLENSRPGFLPHIIYQIRLGERKRLAWNSDSWAPPKILNQNHWSGDQKSDFFFFWKVLQMAQVWEPLVAIQKMPVAEFIVILCCFHAFVLSLLFCMFRIPSPFSIIH